MSAGSPHALEELESTLCQINEIKAARVIAGKDGAVQEVHVLASAEKRPRDLVREIEALLKVEYGVSVNQRKISVAQIGESDEAAGGQSPEESVEPAKGAEKPERSRRPRIMSIHTDASGVRTTVTVTLELNGVEYEGVAKGPATQTGQIRLVSLATLDAIEKFTRGAASFALEDVHILSLGRERVAAACVMLITQSGEEAFTGSAAIKQNENDSIVRATLDAINRRFTYLSLQ